MYCTASNMSPYTTVVYYHHTLYHHPKLLPHYRPYHLTHYHLLSITTTSTPYYHRTLPPVHITATEHYHRHITTTGTHYHDRTWLFGGIWNENDVEDNRVKLTFYLLGNFKAGRFFRLSLFLFPICRIRESWFRMREFERMGLSGNRFSTGRWVFSRGMRLRRRSFMISNWSFLKIQNKTQLWPMLLIDKFDQ